MSIFNFFSNNKSVSIKTELQSEQIHRQIEIMKECQYLVNASYNAETVVQRYQRLLSTLDNLSKYNDADLISAGFKFGKPISDIQSSIHQNRDALIHQAIEKNFSKEVSSRKTIDGKINCINQLSSKLCNCSLFNPDDKTYIMEYANSLISNLQYRDHEPHIITTSADIENDFFKPEYVCISTSGDENVCPMCAQFEGKYFLINDAPKLPLCPLCACAYMYYDKQLLPTTAKISKSTDFTLPADCTPLFYQIQHAAYEEKDIQKVIQICEEGMRKLPEFMMPYITAKFNVPELACRDLLPELYMRLGEWDKAEFTIKRCILANAYYPDDGSEELAYLESYRKVANSALSYISENPGCLQRNIYKVLSYDGDERDNLKHFLRNSLLITKEKAGNTNKLYIAKARE